MKYRGLPRAIQVLLWLTFAAVVGLIFYGSLPSAVAAIFHLADVEPEKIPWMTSRITAFLSYGALAASSIYGLAMTTKTLDAIARRVVTDTLHENLSFWGLLLGITHAVLLMFDDYIQFTWESILIPFASSYRPDAVAYGIIALYLTALLVITSKARRWIGLRLWRAIHLLAFVAFGLLTAHGLAAGTDSGTVWARALYIGSVTLVVFFFSVRILQKITGANRR
jgi:sulfoxide reductase heme-binding subunit YedZ